MTRRAWAAAACLTAAMAAAEPLPDHLLGSWRGRLEVPGGQLTLTYTLGRAPDGANSATVSVLEQGVSNLPVVVGWADGVLTMQLVEAAATYRATYQPDPPTLTGTFEQGGAVLPLTCHPLVGPAGPDRPQEPQPPFSYQTAEVRVPGEPTLSGTLTLPPGAGPHPAMVLVSGSGPQDRDSSLLGHRPFLIWADWLTRHGLAVLRYDERGVGESAGEFATATTADFAADAARAWRWLAGQPGIDPERVGLLGHSEGGLVAPLAAVSQPAVGCLVLLAPPGVPGEALIVRQAALLAQADGAPADTVASHEAAQRELMKLALADHDDTTLLALAEPWMAPLLAGLPAEVAETARREALAQLRSPWLRFFLRHDPAPVLRQVRCPVLALFGSLDRQVEPAQNLPAVAASLAGHPNHSLRCLPGLNHLFQSATTGSPAEYALISETVNAGALRAVVDWLRDLGWTAAAN